MVLRRGRERLLQPALCEAPLQVLYVCWLACLQSSLLQSSLLQVERTASDAPPSLPEFGIDRNKGLSQTDGRASEQHGLGWPDDVTPVSSRAG